MVQLTGLRRRWLGFLFGRHPRATVGGIVMLVALIALGVYAVFAFGLQIGLLLFVALIPGAFSGARAADRWDTAVTVGARVGTLGGITLILLVIVLQSVRSLTAIGQVFPLMFSSLGLVLGLAIVPLFGIEGMIGGYVGFALSRGLSSVSEGPKREN